jgi:hypothetical protein
MKKKKLNKTWHKKKRKKKEIYLVWKKLGERMESGRKRIIGNHKKNRWVIEREKEFAERRTEKKTNWRSKARDSSYLILSFFTNGFIDRRLNINILSTFANDSIFIFN